MRIPQLATSMRFNGIFSAASGGAGLVLAWVADRPLGLNPWLLVVLGLGLLGYGIQLTVWSRDDSARRSGAIFATLADAGWVIAAVTILIVFPTALDSTGRLVLAIATLVVADFALLQFVALRAPTQRRATA